jgi:heme oxygenase
MALPDQLRWATADWHARVEQLPLVHGLLEGGPDLAGYRRYLLRWAGLVWPLERMLQAALSDHRLAAWAGAMNRRVVMAEDLAGLGLPAPPPEAPLAPPDSPGAVIGGLYVLEGSRLGGLVQARHLRRHLPAAASSLRHFEQPAPPGLGWGPLRARLAGFDDAQTCREATDYAAQLFRQVFTWLAEGQGVSRE